MASPAARKRLMKELATMQLEGCPPYTYARPEESNILIWHFVFMGTEDSPYKDGEYHGVLEFPKDYPFSPPHIKFHTPSGRFKPNTSICTSFSDFHKDTWNPMLSVSTILTSLLSFFNEDAVGTGGMTSTPEERKRLAKASKAFNRDRTKNVKFSKVFDDLLNPASGQKSLDDALIGTTMEKKKEGVVESVGMADKGDKEAEETKGAGDDTTKLEKPLNGLSLDSSATTNSTVPATESTPKPPTKPPMKKGSAMSRFRAKVKNSDGDAATES